jgi:polyhydroxyalkanoate synthesis regulator phasin
MKADEATWAKWQGWTRTIEAELQRVLFDQLLFDDFRGVCEQNGDWIDEHQGDFFTGLVKRSYAASAFMAIRRQLKTNDQSVSLLRLLSELAAQSHQLTLDRFKELQGEGNNKAFDWRKDALEKLADDQNKNVVSRARVESDIAEIKALTKQVEEIADRVVAHHDPRGSEANVSFDDLHTSIEALDRIVHKYIVFFIGSYWSGETLRPNVIDTRRNIFDVPLRKPPV